MDHYPAIKRYELEGLHYCEKDGDTVVYRSDGQGRTYAVCVECGDKLVIVQMAGNLP